jgi:hypothetical protein
VQTARASSAWYAASIEAFRAASAEEILGALAANSGFDIVLAQRNAWRAEIDFLRERLSGVTGSILFEFSIPRMGRRIDVVLLLAGVVFVVEFKIGAAGYDSSAIDQVWGLWSGCASGSRSQSRAISTWPRSGCAITRGARSAMDS